MISAKLPEEPSESPPTSNMVAASYTVTLVKFIPRTEWAIRFRTAWALSAVRVLPFFMVTTTEAVAGFPEVSSKANFCSVATTTFTFASCTPSNRRIVAPKRS